VGGIAIWAGLDQMVANLVAGGAEDMEIIGAVIFELGPTLLFPVWGQRLRWRRWATITGGAARAVCVVVAHPARSGIDLGYQWRSIHPEFQLRTTMPCGDKLHHAIVF